MDIHLATNDTEIEACYPVMQELRPHIDSETFVSLVRKMLHNGYHLAYLQIEGSIVAVAGFHLAESLAWGRYLYVDDLVGHAENSVTLSRCTKFIGKAHERRTSGLIQASATQTMGFMQRPVGSPAKKPIRRCTP